MTLESGEIVGICIGGRLNGVVVVFPNGDKSQRWVAAEGTMAYRRTNRIDRDGWPIYEPY